MSAAEREADLAEALAFARLHLASANTSVQDGILRDGTAGAGGAPGGP
jgi:hypothetical protein